MSTSDGAGTSRIDYSDGVDISDTRFISSGFAPGGWFSVATGESNHLASVLDGQGLQKQRQVPRPSSSKAPHNDSSVWFYEEDEEGEESEDEETSARSRSATTPPVATPNGAAVPAVDGSHAALPSRDTTSNHRQKKAKETQRSELVDAGLSRMYHQAMDRKLARQQWACLERAKMQVLAEAAENCTFKPTLSKYARSIRRPRSLSPHNRAQAELRRRMEWRSAQTALAVEEALRECTFKPLTLSAAKLHASALLHESHLFSKLHAHAKEVQVFKETVVEQAAQMLELKLARKGRPPPAALSEEEVRDVVQRLVASGAKIAGDAPVTGSFRPTVDPKSEALVEERRRRSPETPQDVVERLLSHAAAGPAPVGQLRPSISRSDSEAGSGGRGRSVEDRRADPRIPALSDLYRLLAEACIAQASGGSPGDVTDRQLHEMSLPAPAVARAAVSILPQREAEEVVAMFTAAGLVDSSRVSLDDFVQMALREIRRSGPKQFVWSVQSEMGRRRHSSQRAANEEEAAHRPAIGKRSTDLAAQRASAGGDVVDRLHRQHQLRQERQRHVSAVAEEQRLRLEMAECTFRPKMASQSRQAGRARSGEDGPSATVSDDDGPSAERTAAGGIPITSTLLSPPSSEGNQSFGTTGAAGAPTTVQAEPVRPASSHVRSASSGGVSGSASPAIRRLSGSLSPGGFADYAAFDSPQALNQFGAELMRRQLEKKRKLTV